MPAVNGQPPFGVPDGATIGEETMTVYSGPVFDMAVNQFGVIANHISAALLPWYLGALLVLMVLMSEGLNRKCR
jgi:hypothetical protein